MKAHHGPRDEGEERRSGQEPRYPTSAETLGEEVAQEILEVAGFRPEDLFERRGPLTTRGLAYLLQPGDEVLEVLSDHVRIRRRDGSVQSFWNIRKLPSWVQRVSGGGEG